MGMIPLSDEVQRLLDGAVASGLASTPAEFVEAAVLRMLTDAAAERAEIMQVAARGIADIEAGRYVPINSKVELRRVFDDMVRSALQKDETSAG